MTKKSSFKYFFAFLIALIFGYNGNAYTKGLSGNINVIDSITPVTCSGGVNGIIDLTVSGLNAPFTFLWSTNETTEDISNLSAGTYTCTVFDATGDSLNLSFNVSEPSNLTIAGSTTDISCFGYNDGHIDVSVSGGNGGNTFLWNDGSVAQNINGLVAGNYTVTVTDSLGCIASSTFLLTQPSVLSITNLVNNVTCYGYTNGEVDITASGGSGSFHYNWNTGSIAEDLLAVGIGTYTVTVTDGNGCSETSSMTVGEPSAISINASVTNIACFGGANGSINITATGGSGLLNYLWSNNSTSEDLTNVNAGVYSVTVTDVNGCSNTSSSMTVSEPSAISINASVTNVACFGQSNGSITQTVNGGVSPYSYVWSNNSTSKNLQNVIAGNYSVVVTDDNGCTTSESYTINQPTSLNLSGVVTDDLCNGSSDGSINISVTGGTAPYGYLWSNGSTTQDINGLAAGTYTVTVTDVNNCTVLSNYNVSEPSLLAITFSIINPACGSLNGRITSTVNGGTSGYSYLWSNAATSTSINNLAAGTYSLTVTDANGCTTLQSALLVNQVAPSISSAITTNVSCNGASNGAIDITVTGGTSPLVYSWSNGQTSQDVSGLSAGVYTVNITDARNCININIFTISQPTALSANIISSATTCNLNNGSATVNSSGGSGAYLYLWNNASTSSTLTNLSTGNYTVTITDINGCSIIRSVTVTATLPPVVVQSALTNVLCNGDSTGAITISVNNGTAPFTFLWSNGAITQNISNLKNGSYTVTVTDANGCTNSKSFTITQPAFLSLANFSVVNTTCGQANGSAQINPAGGVSPYTYLWSNGSTINQVVNVSSGSYSVTVTDANGCTRRKNMAIANTTGPALTLVSKTDVSCFGLSTGAIDISVNGGLAPYSYQWSNSTTSQDLSGIPAGIYTVTVTDANNCTATASYTINQTAAIAINPTITNAGCIANSGSVSTHVTGGVSPYNYTWSNGGASTFITNLSAGNYSLTVTDNNGCITNWSGSVTGAGSPTASFTISNPRCWNSPNGSIASTVSGGTPPYNYLWNNGSTSSGIANLAGGNYTLTITDQSGCTAVYTNTLVTPDTLKITSSVTNIGCYSGNTGSIQVVTSGGIAPYTYLWNTGASTNSISNLIAGSYVVTITDSNNCIKTGVYNILQNSLIQVASYVVVGNICNGANAGAINLSITGGSGSYTYQWSNGATTEDISNLFAGIYSLTVSDSLGCSNSFTYTVTDLPAITATTSSVNTTCGVANGSASVVASGGSGTLSYLWNTGATTSTINNITAGPYTVTISDVYGCTLVKSITVTNQAGPSITSGIVTNPLCYGGSNGSINISVTVGTILLNYNWSNGQSSQDANGLSAGNYTVTITDANNCSTTASYIVNQPANISASFVSNPSTCNQSNGTISVTATGGTPGYSYLWSNGNSSSSINSLAAGNYTVTITDNHGCSILQNTVVPAQPSPVVIQNSLTNVLCNGDSTGAITISINNGTLPFNFLWSNGTTSQNISNLINGSYSVTVTDANGCTGTKSFFITQPSFLSLANFTIVNSTCGQANGSVLVNPSGGVGPYTYLWNNNSVSNQLVNVNAGLYSVTVTDANGCTRKRNFTIQNTNGPVLTLSNQTNVSCYGGSNGALDILVSSGVTPYTYLWSNGAVSQDISNISAGDYTVTVTDANGCIAGQQFTVTQPDSISIIPIIVSANCGQSSGSISVQVSGGISPYSYSWSSGGTTSSVNSLLAGNYTLTVVDARLCSSQRTFAVGNNPGPSIITDTVINSTCFNQSLGSIAVSLTNGTAPFVYLWSNGSTTLNNPNLLAGNYTLTVSDINGCTTSKQFAITQPSQITASFNVTNANCNLSNGSVVVTANGGVGNYTYHWSNGIAGNTISNQALGNYSVIITDINNCSIIDSVNIFNSGQATVSLVTQINPTCNGYSNGQLTVNVIGGLGPYQMLWSNGTTSYNNTNLAAGNYVFTVTDITGCASQTSYTLVAPPPLGISFVPSDEHCGHADGSLNTLINGGNGFYTYLWSTGSTSSLISNLSSGTYTLTVTDNLGCSANASQTVINISGPVVAQSQVTNANCYNSATGIIDIDIQGGVGPYTYLWNNNAVTEDIVNMIAGTYSVTVTDVYGCTVRKTYAISQPDSISISSVVDNAGCGNNNGEISIAVSGGIVPYSYNWSNGLTNDTIQNLYAGVYSVIVADFNNCIAQKFIAVGNINSTAIAVDSVHEVNCFNESNGSIYPSLSQGEPPFTYEWSTGATSLNLLNQPAGQYVLTVTDNNGCVSILIDTIFQPNPIQIQSFLTQPKCNLSNGGISVIVNGGTLPYNYLWNTGQTSSTIAGLNTGLYTLTVTDSHGCTATRSDSLINSGSPVITLVSIDSVSCNGLSNGSIDVAVGGGLSPYFYQWVGVGQNTEDLSNIPAGGYSLIVTDDLGCTTSQSYTIYQPLQIQVNLLAVQNASCGTNNGSAVVNAVGGDGNFNYYWSNATNNDTLSNVFAGSYTLVAMDGSGCSSSIIVNISNINGPIIAAIDSGNVTCPDVNNGYISISVTGGSLPYTYSWSNLPDTTANVINLTGGAYTLTVTDALNCIAVRTVVINKPQPIAVNGFAPILNSPYNLSCHRSNDGSIILNVSGGTSPYNYVWSNGNISQNVSNLQAGTYTVYLTDHNGCVKDSTFFITQPPQLIAYAGTDFNVCGQTSTSLNALAPNYGIGGWVVTSGPSTVLFADSTSNTTLISNLSIGDYQMLWIVSDGVCADSDRVLVNVASEIIANAGSDQTLCGNLISLNATRPQFGNGYWYNANGIAIADTADPFTQVSNLNYGANIFNWIVVNGTCRDTGIVTVFVRDSIDCLDPVLLPNAFTPNNDGYNDYFEVKGIQDFLDNEITIFNRWGVVVYHKENYSNTWDGRDNSGNTLSDGTYFAVLKLNSLNKFYKTYIDLRR
ncbi:MAG: gliding motility-associated C-terminal domain-containing protein [Bacteroidota bacterium]